MFTSTPGKSFPLGAHLFNDGVNFSVYSRHADGIDLLLFDQVDDDQPVQVISLDPRVNHTYHYWHVFVPNLKPGQLYAYRAHGPFDPGRGLRFDSSKVLLDPYGRALAIPPGYDRGAAYRPGDNTPVAMKSVVVDPSNYDWEGDQPLHRPFHQTVIYEMHVAGFTRHPNSGLPAQKRGTYAGLIEKIPYLQELGITAVELLPVFAFDLNDAPSGLVNYWGYSPVSFFSPHPGYSARQDFHGPVDEFRDMVKALHRVGIEVILDVVYNHTTEGNQDGPNLCFRGLANETYYILESDPTYYSNYAGTGNTLNANEAVVRRLIGDSLRYWVSEMHVDGFRFDLASILDRDENGQPLANPPILWDIETDPILAGTKLIAEAWDAAGLYQVGSFIGDWWKEWNGRFRDDVRSFFRGDQGMVGNLADRLLASPNLYIHEGREATQSINFVTCHDGFTLNDLVSYNSKHNEANGEANRDGNDNNLSWNHGVEGLTGDPQVEQLRSQEVKNFLACTLVALGTPMVLMGDEVRRTQLGNNNAYCQDNEISWFDWSLLNEYADIRRFLQLLIQFRLNYTATGDEDSEPLSQVLRQASITWHGVHLNQPDWSPDSHSLSVTLMLPEDKHPTHLIFNAFWEALNFELPSLPDDNRWRRLVDTSLPSPADISDFPHAVAVPESNYLVQPHSVVILVG